MQWIKESDYETLERIANFNIDDSIAKRRQEQSEQRDRHAVMLEANKSLHRDEQLVWSEKTILGFWFQDAVKELKAIAREAL